MNRRVAEQLIDNFSADAMTANRTAVSGAGVSEYKQYEAPLA